jgi:uncharacterized protein YdaU (DUF1376 family)
MEHGAYALLLDHYYATGKPLDANASVLHRICRAFASDEQAAVDGVIRQFFVLEADGYHNKKADEQLGKRLIIKKKRSLAAQAKWAAHADAHADANGYANAPTSTSTSTVKKKGPSFSNEKEARQAPLPDPKAVFYSLASERLGKSYGAIATQLLKATGGRYEVAIGILEDSQAHDPKAAREYVCGAIKRQSDPNGYHVQRDPML